jgi:hypothetical protein
MSAVECFTKADKTFLSLHRDTCGCFENLNAKTCKFMTQIDRARARVGEESKKVNIDAIASLFVS